MTLYSYNWSVDLGLSLNRELVRLVKWQNARAHVVHCLLNQKMGLFHHYCFSDAPIHEMDSKQVWTLTHFLIWSIAECIEKCHYIGNVW